MRPCASTLESELKPDELECLTALLREGGKLGQHLEIGTAAGGTLWRMMDCFSPEERPPFVVIDPLSYFENQHEVVLQNLRDHGIDPAGVEFRQTTSAAAYAKTEHLGESFDFILIDGNHKLRYVTEDLRWTSRLNPGGYVCLHDCVPKFPGVTLSSGAFLKRNPHYEVVHHVDSLLVIRKNSPSTRPEVSAAQLACAHLRTPLIQLGQSFRKRLAKLRG